MAMAAYIIGMEMGRGGHEYRYKQSMQAMTPRVTASTVSLRAFGFQPNAWPLIEELSGFPNRRPNLGMERPYLRLAAFCLGHRIKIV